jgi:hypothetical protein
MELVKKVRGKSEFFSLRVQRKLVTEAKEKLRGWRREGSGGVITIFKGENLRMYIYSLRSNTLGLRLTVITRLTLNYIKYTWFIYRTE